MGLCPFHTEKSPSFTVSPTKQFYHCFGCGAHGSAISFLMAHTGASFPDAVESLATTVGLSVPKTQQSPAARKQSQERKIAQMTHEKMLDAAQAFYVEQLKKSPEAIAYLKKRGLTGQIAAKFGLGWSPEDRQGLSHVFPRYEDDMLVEAGLVVQSEDGRRYDRFRERVMFPIRNAKGQMIGFGGRIIGKGEPKYLNSPETPLFSKGNELYGLWEARQAIRAADQVIVVEGYMDVVGLAQLDVANAVATLGTATTSVHIQKLMRAANSIVFSFDGDQAGRKAAWRALQTCLSLLRDDVSIRFLFLPAEHDPDSYIREYGQAAFKAALKDSEALSTFLLNELSSRHRLSEAEGRSACLHEAKPLLAQIPDIALRVQLLNAFAQRIQLTPEELAKLLAQSSPRDKSLPMPVKSKRASPQDAGQGGEPPFDEGYAQQVGLQEPTRFVPKRVGRGVVAPLAKRLFMLLISHPNLVDQMGDSQLEVLEAGEHFELVMAFIVLIKASQARHLGALIEMAQPDSELHQVLTRLSGDALNEAELPDPQLEWSDALLRIELENLKREQQRLISRGLSQPEDNKIYQELSQRIKSLINEFQNVPKT